MTEMDSKMEFIKEASFPVNGQGILILTSKLPQKDAKSKEYYVSYKVVVTSDDAKTEEKRMPETYIALEIDENKAQFVIKEKGYCATERVLTSTDDEGVDDEIREKAKVQPHNVVGYWFSYDRDLMVLKYGKGYQMKETTLLMYDFLADSKGDNDLKIRRKRYEDFFTAEKKKRVIVYGMTDQKGMSKGIIDVQPLLQFRPNPLVGNLPALIKDSSKVTLFDLDRGQFMFSSSLPSACQELYGNIKNLVLEYPENPIMKLSDAIRYSIVTEGKTLYNKLQEKDEKFRYLRVTLGPDSRTGPGIPYVLQIWPSGQSSPVQNHGNTCAIIKVLFGRITIRLFNQQTDPPAKEPEFIKKFDVKEGDITWISPDWYQTHQLKNNTNDFCATIQCYRYAENDTIHWPGFDYYATDGETGKLDVFYPECDFTFMNMRSLVLEEYRKYLCGTSNDCKTDIA